MLEKIHLHSNKLDESSLKILNQEKESKDIRASFSSDNDKIIKLLEDKNAALLNDLKKLT